MVLFLISFMEFINIEQKHYSLISIYASDIFDT